MIKPLHLKPLLVVTGLALCSSAFAAKWTVVPETSSVGFVGTQQGTKFNGRFQTFTANINLDAADPTKGSIVGTVFQKWTAVTGGFDGFAVPTPTIFGFGLDGANGIYYTSLVVLIFVLWLTANILRSPMGRAMVAMRDRPRSGQNRPEPTIR